MKNLLKGYYHMDEWKTIPPNTRIIPKYSTWRLSDLEDNQTDYICRGFLMTEDRKIIECIIGFCEEIDPVAFDSGMWPKYYKEIK